MKRREPIIIELKAGAIGGRLARARRSYKLSQKTVGRRVGVSKSSVSAYEQGDRVPPLDKLCALCVLLRRSFEWILFGVPKNGAWWKFVDVGSSLAGDAGSTPTRLPSSPADSFGAEVGGVRPVGPP